MIVWQCIKISLIFLNYYKKNLYLWCIYIQQRKMEKLSNHWKLDKTQNWLVASQILRRTRRNSVNILWLIDFYNWKWKYETNWQQRYFTNFDTHLETCEELWKDIMSKSQLVKLINTTWYRTFLERYIWFNNNFYVSNKWNLIEDCAVWMMWIYDEKFEYQRHCDYFPCAVFYKDWYSFWMHNRYNWLVVNWNLFRSGAYIN